MKEKYCGTDSISFLPTVEMTTTGQTTVNSASTEVKFCTNISSISFDEQLIKFYSSNHSTRYSIITIKI